MATVPQGACTHGHYERGRYLTNPNLKDIKRSNEQCQLGTFCNRWKYNRERLPYGGYIRSVTQAIYPTPFGNLANIQHTPQHMLVDIPIHSACSLAAIAGYLLCRLFPSWSTHKDATKYSDPDRRSLRNCSTASETQGKTSYPVKEIYLIGINIKIIGARAGMSLGL